MNRPSDRFTIHTSQLNKHCRIPENPFVSSTLLHPNPPGASPATMAICGNFLPGSVIRFSAEACNPKPGNPGAVLTIAITQEERLVISEDVDLAPRTARECSFTIPEQGATATILLVNAPPRARSNAHTGIRLGPISLGQKLPCATFESAVGAVAARTLLDATRLQTLWQAARHVIANGIAGDIVECGTYRGGSAGLLGLATLGAQRKLWLYDSFEGMPTPTANDGHKAANYVGKLACLHQEVSDFLVTLALDQDYLEIVPGWFKDSFQRQLPHSISVLHCDADWYESVKLVLETMYPRVSEGGYVVLDDFGYWEGCRAAFFDFCKEAGIAPLLERTGPWQAHWQKGREHNRKNE
jgi:O-methyltransferase